MKPKATSRRRPPNHRPAKLDVSSGASPSSQGGPSTRGDTKLGRLLAEFLAFFEVRSVSIREIDLLRPTHENGWLRPEIEEKLAQLHPTCPDHLQLRRLVTLSLDLLSSVDAGHFNPGPAWPRVEPRLLRALAYFVRGVDAIPDHLPHGFDDDMREFQELADRASGLFDMFEAVQARDAGQRR
ncbi:MAG: hypothetical protein U1G07_12040 [Verrucomicrobiota bacterium]